MAEAPCPECRKPAVPRFAPFCSARCQQIDLGRWLKGGYVIPGRPDAERQDPAIAPAGEEDEE